MGGNFHNLWCIYSLFKWDFICGFFYYLPNFYSILFFYVIEQSLNSKPVLVICNDLRLVSLYSLYLSLAVRYSVKAFCVIYIFILIYCVFNTLSCHPRVVVHSCYSIYIYITSSGIFLRVFSWVQYISLIWCLD